jgi:hypothetical protein
MALTNEQFDLFCPNPYKYILKNWKTVPMKVIEAELNAQKTIISWILESLMQEYERCHLPKFQHKEYLHKHKAHLRELWTKQLMLERIIGLRGELSHLES